MIKPWLPEPDIFYFAGGTAEGVTQLNAFDACLLASGIGNTNLVKMSSIIPPYCKESDPVALPYGSIVPVAYAYISSDLPGEIISAAVAAAIPEDPLLPGLIMEYSARGHKETIEEIVINMAKEGMKTRGFKVKEIKSRAVEHKVERIGGAFACVALWNSALKR